MDRRAGSLAERGGRDRPIWGRPAPGGRSSGAGVTARDRARAHGVLSAPARLEILDQLRGSGQPADAGAVAAAVGLHVTTVRAHLDALIEAGLVVSQRQPPKGRGRPRTLYAPSFREGGQGGDPSRDNPYRTLSDLLATHF